MAHLKSGLILLFLMTALTGFIYPLTITGIAQVLFPHQANGSLIEVEGKVVGSEFIGQEFESLHYFWGRPSATSPYPYNGVNSSGSNMGPSNPDFLKTVQDRVKHLRDTDPQKSLLIPVDLVTASGSGLDPEISPEAALYQVPRIAVATKIPQDQLEDLIFKTTKNRTFDLLGEPRVNVLELNLALDALRKSHGG